MRTITGRRRFAALLGAAVTATILSASVAPAAQAPQYSAFYKCTMDCIVADTAPIAGTRATLYRTTSGQTVTVSSKGLTPGNVHTIWFVVFNAPHNCISNRQGPFRCGTADVFEPLAEASHVWGGGFRAAANGTVVATAGIRTGDLTHVPFPWEPGLTNPYHSEVAVALRDHGAPNGAADQATTMNGGCVQAAAMVGTGSVGTNDCQNRQIAMFVAT